MSEAQGRIDSAEFSDWLAFWEIEPWGEERADLRNAALCAIVANAVRTKGRRAKIKDFMPQFDQEPTPRQSPAQMRSVMDKFTASHNARIAGGK